MCIHIYAYSWKIHSVVQTVVFIPLPSICSISFVCHCFLAERTFVAINLSSIFYCIAHCTSHFVNVPCVRCTYLYYMQPWVSKFQARPSIECKTKPIIWDFSVFWHLFKMKGTMNAEPTNSSTTKRNMMLQIESVFFSMNWIENWIWLTNLDSFIVEMLSFALPYTIPHCILHSTMPTIEWIFRIIMLLLGTNAN